MEMKMSEEKKVSRGQSKTSSTALSCRRFHKGLGLLFLSAMLSLSALGCGSKEDDIGLTGDILYGETRAVFGEESREESEETAESERETDKNTENKKSDKTTKNGEKKEKETKNNKDASSDKSTRASDTKKDAGKEDKKSDQNNEQTKDGQKTETKSDSRSGDSKTSASGSKQADSSSGTTASKDADQTRKPQTDTSKQTEKAADSTTAAPTKAPETKPSSQTQAETRPAAQTPTQAPTQPAPAPTEAPKPTKPAVTLTGISAAYTGGAKTEGESVSGAEIAVTAQYSDGSSKAVGGWACGEANQPLSAGSHTFTVTYEGKSSSFTVNVAAKPAPTQAPTEAPTQAPTQPAPAPTEAPQPATSQAYIDEFMRGFNQARVDAGLPGDVGINPKWSGYAQYYAEYMATVVRQQYGGQLTSDWHSAMTLDWAPTNEGVSYHPTPYAAGYAQADHIGALQYVDFGDVGVGVYYKDFYYYVCVQQWEDEDYPD
ncbi:MAG: hypothetical protein IJV50_08480 [Lachnospiraceae bacterium]|nr:hypothetical protein [Lachnospiraceae bacterium]